jgi:carbamoyltransferase
MAKYILGVSAFYHDSAACLVRDGEIVAASQEERFSRVKGDSGFPAEAARFCLEAAGIRAKDLDAVVFYDKPIRKFDRILSSYIHTAPRGLRSFLQALPIWLKHKLWTEDAIRKELHYDGEVLFTEHHQAHAASAFYPSPFPDAAILTVDGAGEWTTTLIAKGRGNELRMIKKLEFPHSLGLLYSAFTYYCGFRVNSGEYKLMGLAPYGRPIYLDLIEKELVRVSEDGSFTLNERYFDYITGMRMVNRRFEKLFGQPALSPDEKPAQFHMDIAASVQEFTSRLMVLLAREARKATGLDRLCMAGGVALNCVSNSRILRESGFRDVWVQPASGDAGGAIGAALFEWYARLGNSRSADGIHDCQKASLLGLSVDGETAKKDLDRLGANYRQLADEELFSRTASDIANGKVVAWVQGKGEFGPRALGNRSILGDPRSDEMQSRMNLKIKFRESFRPFAPAILEEKTREWFEWDRPSSYMLFVADLDKSKRNTVPAEGKTGLELLHLRRSVVPAITHVDFSARLQTVSAVSNPRFYALIREFDRQTGCPLLINTSFNVRGEPIVNSAADAYACFMATGIDVLVADNYYLVKEDQPEFQGMEKWKKTLIRD